ncbi:MAG TPA: monovalent cation/H(+) antiporter subunit G [Moheibacter sp.]|nr:monovalent cation/H(+) antiporter subunit G [Moheibacter sp.]
MTNFFIMTLCTLGALFILISALGILRMPDFYTRLSVTVKASTMGVGLILLAAAFYFFDFAVSTKVFAIIFFLFITTPVGAFMISKTAYIIGIKLWDESVIDELKDSGIFEEEEEEKEEE